MAKLVKWLAIVFGGIVATVLVLFAFFQWFVRHPYVPIQDPPRVQMPPRYFHKFDPTKIDMHIGPNRFKVGVDYIMMQPFVGGDFTLEAVWPSMRSVDEEVDIHGAKVDGKPGVRVSDTLHIEFSRVNPDLYTDTFKSWQPHRHPHETLADLGLYVQRNKGDDLYWAMDPTIVTPLQHAPLAFHCSHNSEGREPMREICDVAFQMHPELAVRIIFNKTHLANWKSIYFKTQTFIESIDGD